MQSSTFRAAIEPTIEDPTTGPQSLALRKIVCAEWRKTGRADLVIALRKHPQLSRDKSLLLTLAVEEFKIRSKDDKVENLEQYCRRFEEFGNSIQRSILRQIEAQLFIEVYPELLEVLSTLNWPQVDDEIGNFRVIKQIGEGATSRVYICTESKVGHRLVVLKTTPVPSPEASVLGKLNHPNIIPIYSTGYDSGWDLHFICMPFRGRSTMSDLLDVAFQFGCPKRDTCIPAAANRWVANMDSQSFRRRRNDFASFGVGTYVDAVLRLVTKIADALDHAHKQGILHGDIKPSNVLIAPDGEPLLLDFNLSQDGLTTNGTRGGTFPYMPPEHLRVVAGLCAESPNSQFSAASDIYSFGALLYELLGGTPPVRLPKEQEALPQVAASLYDQIKAGIPQICQRNSFVSRRLESLVLQCLAFDPANRPTTIEIVLKSLKSEMRSLAAVGRTARIRPLLFSLVVGLPTILGTSFIAYSAMRPPRYLAAYSDGRSLMSAGDFGNAAQRLTTAVEANPDFVPAQFDRARSWVKLGELDRAIDAFSRLARQNHDVNSMAYTGYCFSLKKLGIAALPWYLWAAKFNRESAPICNNLGATYMDAQTNETRARSIELADEWLGRALQLDPESTAVQLNIVRLALVKASADKSFNPIVAWPQALSIMNGLPGDRFALSHIAVWYRAVKEFDALHGYQDADLPPGQKAAREQFAELYESFTSSQEPNYLIGPVLPKRRTNEPGLAEIYFYIEPTGLSD